MNRISETISLLFQLLVTFLVLFTIYMVYALLDLLEIDMMAGFGFLLFQPILGFLISVATMVGCLVVGLPIRLIKTIRDFWLSKPLLPLAGVALGFFLLLLSFHGNFTEQKEVTIDIGTIQKEIPNTTLVVTGWLMTAFSLLHVYPQALLRRFRNKKR